MRWFAILVLPYLVLGCAATPEGPTPAQMEEAKKKATDCGPPPSDYRQRLEALFSKLMKRPEAFEITEISTPRRELLTWTHPPRAVYAYVVDMDAKEKGLLGRSYLRTSHYFCDGEFRIWGFKDLNKP